METALCQAPIKVMPFNLYSRPGSWALTILLLQKSKPRLRKVK